MGTRNLNSAPRLRPRHLAWNAAGLVLPVVAAFASIPLLIHNFGLPRFGVFSLMLALYAYAAVLDGGLSSALTYRVSALVAAGESRSQIARTVCSATVAVLALGVSVAIFLYLAAEWAAPLMVGDDAGLKQEAIRGMQALALSVPFVFAAALLAGVLMGFNRFGQVNAVRIVTGVLSALGPALASIWFSDLLVASLILVAVRTGAALTHLVQCLRVLELSRGVALPRPSWSALRSLLHFGGWLTVSNLIGPFMVYMDRFYLAAVRPLEEVTYYVAPYELATKLSMIPAGVLPVVFPLLVARWVTPNQEAERLPVKLAAAMALGCAVPAAVLAVFGPQIITLWTRGGMPAESAEALQVLAGAVFMNCVAQVFFMQTQSTGRTDQIARLHAAELVIYAVLLWILANKWGVVGVALAWGVRVALDMIALCYLAAKRMALRERAECWRILWSTLIFGTLVSMLAWVPWLPLRGLLPIVALLALYAHRHKLIGLFARRLPSASPPH